MVDGSQSAEGGGLHRSGGGDQDRRGLQNSFAIGQEDGGGEAQPDHDVEGQLEKVRSSLERRQTRSEQRRKIGRHVFTGHTQRHRSGFSRRLRDANRIGLAGQRGGKNRRI